MRRIGVVERRPATGTGRTAGGDGMRGIGAALAAGAALALAGCVTVPAGPGVMVLPGSGRTFEQFQVDDTACRQWSAQQAGVAPAEASAQSTVGSAAVGTALGAALGAAIGGASGQAGTGAAIGAASGALGGTLVGLSSGYASAYELQRRYDIAYQQCMYAKGHQIPGQPVARASRWSRMPPPPAPPPPPPAMVPPPPATAPPPPPR